MRGESGKPLVLAFHLAVRPLDARESYRHVIAEPVDGVVRSSGGDAFDRKICPVRKLRREQSANEGSVGGYFACMH
jgi:hypothetical protein